MNSLETYGASGSLKQYLKAGMRIKGIETQEGLAKKCGIHKSIISGFMTGKRELDDAHIEKLCSKVGYDRATLEGYKKKGEDTQLVIDKYLKNAFEKGNPSYEIAYPDGITIKVPLVAAPNSPKEAGRIAQEVRAGLDEVTPKA